ncbi:cytochrome P450 [Alkalilimnicola ehrlichii]|uniref:cytochrome P450 n=1 Tax=Alkalilimnicola ehrlichii TaxID=351052 RepID=UPI001C6F43A4|nr:cytochrome P450 [Alkalilimnicola ehrlichii]
MRDDFDWQGYRFPKNTRVLLDLYGTNRDRRTWIDPEAFRPERFKQWNGSAYNFITQGGGDYYRNHRCPGEWITIELAKVGTTALTRMMRYAVPDQDMSISINRFPMVPRSRFLIENVASLIPVREETAPEATYDLIGKQLQSNERGIRKEH